MASPAGPHTGLLGRTATHWHDSYLRTAKHGDHARMQQVRRHVAGNSIKPVKHEYTRIGTYTGNWHDNKREGMGTQTWANGSVYEGSFSDDTPHGRGSLYVRYKGLSSSLILEYQGDWHLGAKHGQGQQNYRDGSTYTGEWMNGYRHGHGTHIYADGSKYIGNWEHDKRSGRGSLFNAHGDCHDGSWLDDKKHGPGKHIYASKRMVLTGEWIHDVCKAGEMESVSDVGGTIAQIASQVEAEANVETRSPLPALALTNPTHVLAETVTDHRLTSLDESTTSSSLHTTKSNPILTKTLRVPDSQSSISPSTSYSGPFGGLRTYDASSTPLGSYSLDATFLSSINLSPDEAAQLAVAFHSSDPHASGTIPASLPHLLSVLQALGMGGGRIDRSMAGTSNDEQDDNQESPSQALLREDAAGLLHHLVATEAQFQGIGEEHHHTIASISFRAFVTCMASQRDTSSSTGHPSRASSREAMSR